MKVRVVCRCDTEDYYCTDDFEIVVDTWDELVDELNYLEHRVGMILEINYNYYD